MDRHVITTASRAAALVSLAASIMTTRAPGQHALDPARRAAVQLAVDSIIARDALPGLAVAVMANGKLAVNEGHGMADVEGRRAVSPSTLFRIGSVSKMLTIIAAARLVDQKRLDLDAPIGRYLPALSPALAPITARQLAGHLGGIRHYGLGEYNNRTRYDRVGASLSHFINQPPIAPAGARYIYTSNGYNLLGTVLEAASGKEFRRLVEDEVLRPLGMKDTRAELDAGGAGQARLYQRDTSGVRAADSLDVTDRWPSGGYLSTAADLARFATGIMNSRYLSDATRAQLFTSQRTSDGKETGVGLGWRIGIDSAGRRFVHHGGLSNGGRAFVLLYPDHGLAVALLTNSTPARFNTAEAQAVAATFLGERGR